MTSILYRNLRPEQDESQAQAVQAMPVVTDPSASDVRLGEDGLLDLPLRQPRVSTTDQHGQMQFDALIEAGVP